MAYSTESRSEEIVRIVAVSMFGGLLMVVKRWFFSAGVIDINVPDSDVWARENFTPAAIIVFLDSVFWAGMWYFLALGSSKNYEPKHERQILIRWVGFFLTTLVITVVVALNFYGNASSIALPLFLGLFLINTVFIYWVSTAISTPKPIELLVPGSGFLRKLFRIDK